jgi:sporulation protein YlmC with PRC-barrel domain
MSREVALHHLLGRTVRDPNGRKVGRIEELRAEIELHEQGNDYVVTEFHVGSFGTIETLAGAHFARQLLLRLGRFAPYERHRIPWNRLDITDPRHPKALDTVEELKAKQQGVEVQA